MKGVDDSRVYCPVCSARFLPKGALVEGEGVICTVCGQMLLLRKGEGVWEGERVDRLSDKEIQDRIGEFARIRGYVFNDMKDEIIEGLLEKRNRFGDFYCPCRLNHENDYQCPCKPTRGGDVERDGRCHCGLFWKPAARQP